MPDVRLVAEALPLPVADGTDQAKPVRVFPFDQPADAHRFLEFHEANGRIVVVLQGARDSKAADAPGPASAGGS